MATQEPAFDCGRFKVTYTRQVPDGKGGVTAMRVLRSRHVMAVDTAGNVAPIKTHNAAANKAQHDPYAMTILQCKWADGWIPYLECPQGTQHARWLPVALQGKPKCKLAADGNAIGRTPDYEPHPCTCVLAVIEARQATQRELEAARAQDKTDQQRILEATERQNELLVKAVGKMAGVDAAPAKDGKK